MNQNKFCLYEIPDLVIREYERACKDHLITVANNLSKQPMP